MTSRSTSALRKPNSKSSASKSKSSAKSWAKAKPINKVAAKTSNKTGKLPEWNLADLYAGIDAPEVARDLAKMDSDCVAFETDYKGRLAEHTAREDGGKWLAEAVRRYEAIDDLAGRLGSYAGLVHAGDAKEISGEPPFKVTVGNKAGLESMTLDGEPVDSAKYSAAAGNVARFSLP